MENSFGKLEFCWHSGPLPTHSTQLSYLTDQSLLYNAGVNLNLLDVNTGTMEKFGQTIGSVSCIALYRCNKWVAHAQLSVDPDVTLLDERGDVIGKFEAGAKLEYSALAFSSDGKYLAGASGVPDFKVFIWEINSYKLVCSVELGCDKRVKMLDFDPQNNSRISLITEEGELFLYKIEKCGSVFSKLIRVEIELPDAECRIGYEKSPITSQLSRPDVEATLHNPIFADMEFYPFRVDTSLLESADNSSVIAQAWGLNNQLYLLTTEAIFLVDGEKGKLSILYRLAEPSYIPPRTAQSTSHRETRVAFPEQEDDVIEQADLITVSETKSADPTCMAVTSQGIVLGFEDGMVRLFDDKNQFVVKGEVSLCEKPQCLIFPPSFSTLSVVTETGCLCSLDIVSQREILVSKLNSINRQPSLGNICLVPFSEDRELVVTASTGGVLLVWEGRDGQLISSIETEEACTTFVGFKSSPVLITGNSSGYLCAFDLTAPSDPKLILTKRLHKESITQLATDIYSQVLISFGNDCNLFIMDARLTSQLNIICSISLHSMIRGVSVYTPSYKETLHIALLAGDNNVITFQFNPVWAEGDLSLYYSDPSTLQLNLEKSNYLISRVTNVLSGMCIAGPSLLYGVSKVSGELVQLILSDVEGGEEGEDVHKCFQIKGRYPGHLLTGARLGEVGNSCTVVSPNLEWVATVYRDGRVLLRRVLEPDTACLEFLLTHYSRDNIQAIVFSDNCLNLYCLSKWGGGLSCVKVEGSGTLVGRQKAQAAIGNKKMRDNAVRSLRDKEIAFLQTQNGLGEVSYRENTSLTAKYLIITGLGFNPDTDTWLDVCNREREEKEKVIYTLQREDLMKGLNELRDTVLKMIEENKFLPEIEQLDRVDFVLDVDRQRDMKLKQDESVKAKEREIHLSNLAKLFLTEQLKDTCWETMTVPGKNVYSFNGKVEVSNYPLNKITEKERKVRQAAMERLEIAKECIDAREDLDGDIGVDVFNNQISRIQQKTDDEEDDREAETGTDGEATKEEIDLESIEGRRAEKHGGPSLPSQFNSRSLLSCRDLVLITHQSVYKVKEFFNQEFDDVLKTKQSEVTRTNERCFRIRQVIQDLKIKHRVEISTKSQTLAMYVLEEPGILLEVKDSEVKIEKYETDREKQQREEIERIEEERRMTEMGDRWRERGLDMMMGGKLEIDTEDELFKELVEPEFLDNPALATDPELQARKQEWQLHVDQVKEEREKHRRALEAELSKLEQSIVDGCQRVDDRIQQLYRNKITADKVVYQEEIKIFTLLAAEMFAQELLKQEEFILKLLEQSREHKLVANERVNETQEYLGKYTESYASSQIDDKNLDRNFKKEHSDMEPHVDALYKLFRKRPRVQKRPVLAGVVDDVTLSVFPITSHSIVQGLKEASDELDAYSNAPEGVDVDSWERLVVARRQKIESEQRLKKQALDLAEIQAYHQELVRDDEHSQSETDAINIELDRLRSVKNRLYFNIQVQLLVKQGQVEVENGSNFLTDHSSSILIFKRTVDELNKQVKLLGREKLDRMRQNMDFKRGIHLLEWEHRKLRMQAEDLQKKAKEIQTLKLTKEIQNRMQESNTVRGNSKADMDLLERTLEYNKKAHDSRLASLDVQLSELNREITKRRDNNDGLEGDLQEAAVAEAERSRLVERERPDPQELMRKRVRGVMLRRRRLDMVKAQTREISALRSELERLRLKTFPALLQVD